MTEKGRATAIFPGDSHPTKVDSIDKRLTVSLSALAAYTFISSPRLTVRCSIDENSLDPNASNRLKSDIGDNSQTHSVPNWIESSNGIKKLYSVRAEPPITFDSWPKKKHLWILQKIGVR